MNSSLLQKQVMQKSYYIVTTTSKKKKKKTFLPQKKAMQKLKRNTVQFSNTGDNLITKTLKLIRFKIAIIKNINSMFNLFARGNKADLPSKSNISKTVKENDSLNSRFLIISLPKISIFALVLLQLLMFKVYENFRILKIEFFNFSKTRHQMMQQYIYYAENDKNNKNNNPNVVCQNVVISCYYYLKFLDA